MLSSRERHKNLRNVAREAIKAKKNLKFSTRKEKSLKLFEGKNVRST